jgi:23S rRNA (pseudouridine1915-N3)-methyltransferase
MKFRFVWIGKTRDRNWKALQDDYLKRLSRFVKCEIGELKDSSVNESVYGEGNRILQVLNPSTLVCLLDVMGRQMNSHELAGQIAKWQDESVKEVTFVIGGVSGVSQQVVERAQSVLSLSFLTFTHEMARVVLLEQLYRAYTIIKGFPYQK